MNAPHFLNVDLEIESEHELAALEAELASKVCFLAGRRVGTGCFSLCLEILPQRRTADDTILALCALLERLSAKARRAWRSAYKKEFDAGYEAGPPQVVTHISFRADTLQRLSKLDATLLVTIYDHSARNLKAPAKSAPVKRKNKRGATKA
jgi:hypothetical protein